MRYLLPPSWYLLSQHNIVATGVERALLGQKKDTTMTCTTATMANAPKMNAVGKRVIHSQERVPQARQSVMNTITTDSTATHNLKTNAACVNATRTSTALALPVKSDDTNTIGMTAVITARVPTNVAYVNATRTSTAHALPVKSDEKNTIGITVATTATVLTNAVWMLQRTVATGVERALLGQKEDTTMTCTTAAMANAPKMNVVQGHVMGNPSGAMRVSERRTGTMVH